MAADDEERESEEEEITGDESENKPAKKEALPLNFGKRLAHTDKVVRDRGFRFFKAWLQRNGQLERIDYLKLWKGLFFGMWMADKRPVQQDLSVKIALLINDIPHNKQSAWIDTFWETMMSTWEKLDVHRMSKFMQFARIVIAESFKILRAYGWKESEVRSFGRTFTAGATAVKGSQSVVSVGLIYHFTHFFWEELGHQLVAIPKATPQQVWYLLEPFCEVVEKSGIHALVNKINDNILGRIPEDFEEPLFERIRVACKDESLSHFNREALAKTGKALGMKDVIVIEKAKETKKQRLKRQKQERTDFVARQRTKRKEITKKAKFCEDFLAKGRDFEESQEASETVLRGVSAERSASPAVSQAPLSPLLLPKAAMGAEKKRKKKRSQMEEGAVADTADEEKPPAKKKAKKGKRKAS